MIALCCEWEGDRHAALCALLEAIVGPWQELLESL